MNQTIVTLALSANRPHRYGFHSHIAKVSDLALVKRCVTDLLSTTEEGNGDRDTTGASETDDGDTEECVESGSRSEVDTGQGHLDSGVEEKGVQWHFETLRHTAPNGVSGNTTISGEATCQFGVQLLAKMRLTPKHI
jgi:hypothetical protein